MFISWWLWTTNKIDVNLCVQEEFSCALIRNRKHVPHNINKHEWKFGRTRKVVGTSWWANRRVFPQLFWVGPIFHDYFYDSIETWRTCFLFLLENPAMKVRKKLIYFDHQYVNSLCLCHPCASSMLLLSFSIKLSTSILSQISSS